MHGSFDGRRAVQSPVWMVFACLVGRDLLYTLYDVPSICISRTNQRGNALARLGLPRTAFDDVDEARWKSQPESSRATPMHADLSPPLTSMGGFAAAGGAADRHAAAQPAYGCAAPPALQPAGLPGGLSIGGLSGGLAGMDDVSMAAESREVEAGRARAGRDRSDSDDDSEWMAIQREAWTEGSCRDCTVLWLHARRSLAIHAAGHCISPHAARPAALPARRALAWFVARACHA